MSIYEYTKKDTDLFDNSTIIRIDSEKDSLVRLIDKLTLNQKANKYKILLLSSETDLIKFNKLYGPNNIKWSLVAKKYGGVAIEFDKIFKNDKIFQKYWFDYNNYNWLDEEWYTDYGFVWRFKLN